jgi:CARDB
MKPIFGLLLAVSVAATVRAQDIRPEDTLPMVQPKDASTCNYPISCGATQSGTLKAIVPTACANYGVIGGQAWVSQFDTYDFAGNAGQVISATLGEHASVNKPILFLLRKSDQSVITSDYSGSVGHATIAARLPETTDYTIGVATLATGVDVSYELIFRCYDVGSPDLVPYQPSGWSGSLVLSTSSTQTTDSPTFTMSDDIYCDVSVTNLGTLPVLSTYSLQLLLDGVSVRSLTDPNDLLPSWNSTWVGRLLVSKPSPGLHTVTLNIDTGNQVVESNESNNTVTKTFSVAGTRSTTCAAGPETLCLSDSRFSVVVAWATNDGRTGQGQAVPMSADTGNFWFFDPANVELVVKVLDGRAINDHFWVFYGALSNVSYTITVTDSENGATRTYINPQGTQASISDTAAF